MNASNYLVFANVEREKEIVVNHIMVVPILSGGQFTEGPNERRLLASNVLQEVILSMLLKSLHETSGCHQLVSGGLGCPAILMLRIPSPDLLRRLIPRKQCKSLASVWRQQS